VETICLGDQRFLVILAYSEYFLWYSSVCQLLGEVLGLLKQPPPRPSQLQRWRRCMVYVVLFLGVWIKILEYVKRTGVEIV
jgi:hypothetical protein